MELKYLIILLIVLTSKLYGQQPIYINIYEVGSYVDTTGLTITNNQKNFSLNEKYTFDEKQEMNGDNKYVLTIVFLFMEYQYIGKKYAENDLTYETWFGSFGRTRLYKNEIKMYFLGQLEYNPEYQTYILGIDEKKLKRQVLLLLTIRDHDIVSIVEVAEYCNIKGFPIDVNTQIDEEGVFHIEKKGYDMSLLFYPKKLQRQYMKTHPDNSISKQSFYLDDAGRVQIIN